jgi:integrase-like protein
MAWFALDAVRLKRTHVPNMSRDSRPVGVPTGHVFRVERVRGPAWYAKYRLPDGRQVQRKLGPAWTDRGRPPSGWFTKRTAEAWLREVLDQARRGELPGQLQTGATFADAAAEWLRFIEEDRERKPSTLVDYRSALKAHLLPAFGDRPLESIEPSDIEEWRRSLVGLSNRSKNKLLILLENDGLLERTAGRGKTWIGVPFSNAKMVKVHGGDLVLDDGSIPGQIASGDFCADQSAHGIDFHRGHFRLGSDIQTSGQIWVESPVAANDIQGTRATAPNCYR